MVSGETRNLERIDWPEVAGKFSGLVRDETRSKYFPANPLRQLIIRNFLRRLGDVLEPARWRDLLDVGCGEGFVDYYLGLRFPGSIITGLDVDPSALEAARGINPGFTYIEQKGEQLPFEDRSFDAVICIEVLEHLLDYGSVMKELHRTAKEVVVISVPAFPFYQLTNFMIGKNLGRMGEHPGHVTQFGPWKLKREMEKVFGDSSHVSFSYPWLLGTAEK